jgi:uncharacterized phage protein (TIGR02220 family)
MDNQRLMFKFYKSYFDIAQELDAKDRLEFYDALLNKQFLDIEPDLKGLAKFAYISQKHNIDKQIKGWKDKMNIATIDPITYPMQGGSVHPAIQLEVKEEVESKLISKVVPTSGIDTNKFVEYFNSVADRKFKANDKIKASLKKAIKTYSKEELKKAIDNAHKDSYHLETNFKYLTPEYILRDKSLEMFINQSQITSKNQIVRRADGIIDHSNNKNLLRQ